MKYGELNLGQIEALVNKVGGMDNVLCVLRGDAEMEIKRIKFLSKLTTVDVPFIENFVLTEQVIKEANVCAWDNFRKMFLGKKEQGVTANRLTIHSLGKNSLDAPIRKELGNREEITLAHFVHLVRQQSQGQDGVLLTNGYANVAYIKGDGNMWAVSAGWDSDDRCWDVNAHSVENPNDWNAGNQVISCYYLLSSALMVEVLFNSPFFQPPTIFPRPSISVPNEIYSL